MINTLEQITKQLYKLIDVIKVVDLSSNPMVARELALIKVNAEPCMPVQKFLALLKHSAQRLSILGLIRLWCKLSEIRIKSMLWSNCLSLMASASFPVRELPR